jgi:hypothetical protein
MLELHPQRRARAEGGGLLLTQPLRVTGLATNR